MKATATIDNEGRMKIPRKVKERLNLQPGSKVSLVIEDGVTTLATAEAPLAKLVMKDGVLVVDFPQNAPISDDDVISAIKADRNDREDRILRRCQ